MSKSNLHKKRKLEQAVIKAAEFFVGGACHEDDSPIVTKAVYKLWRFREKRK